MTAELIRVEVVYALAGKQVLRSLEVPPGTTVGESIELSGLREEFPDMAVDQSAVGIFSVKVGMDRVLSPGDRVEIYRPLIADPKESRRKRAESAKSAANPG